MVGIYKITSPSKKVYIGQSWNIKDRLNGYKRNLGHNKLRYSFSKYGVDNHMFEIIHELPNDITQDILDVYEILYISLYKDCGVKLLNIREGGSRGKLSEETKQKLRKPKSEEWKEKNRKPKSEEHKQKLKKLDKSYTKTKEFSQKISEITSGEKNPMFGVRLSDESIERGRQKQQGRIIIHKDDKQKAINKEDLCLYEKEGWIRGRNPKSIEKMVNSREWKPLSKETKEKIRKTLLDKNGK